MAKVKDNAKIKKKNSNPKNDYFFSQGIEYIDYKNINTLRKFINRQGRIANRFSTQLTAKTQRRVAQAIKRARQMALLPYTIVEQSNE